MAVLTPSPAGGSTLRGRLRVRWRAVLVAVVVFASATAGTAWWLDGRAGEDDASSTPSTAEPPATATSPSRPTTTTTAPTRALVTLVGHTREVQQAVFSPDGTKVVTSGGFDGTVRIWDAVTGAAMATLPAYSMSTEFSTDGTRIVTSSMDGTATVWDVARGELLSTLPGNPEFLGAASAAFRPGGTEVVTARGDDSAWVWDSTTGQLLHRLTASSEDVLFAAFSPDGTMILTSRWGPVSDLWAWPSGRLLHTLDGGPLGSGPPFSPDSTRVITHGSAGAQIWDVATGDLITSLRPPAERMSSGIGGATFSPDGATVLTVDHGTYGLGGSVMVWDASTGASLASSEQSTITSPAPASATFNPDGTTVAVVRHDSTGAAPDAVELWDPTLRELVQTIHGHTGIIVTARFSPDGSKIVTASHDRTAKIWAVTG